MFELDSIASFYQFETNSIYPSAPDGTPDMSKGRLFNEMPSAWYKTLSVEDKLALIGHVIECEKVMPRD